MPDYDFKNRIKLIELLKKHTDKEHPLTQAKLRDVSGADSVMGYKNSFTRRLFEIADAYNTNESGQLLDEKEWKIVYPGYKARHSQQVESGIRNGKIYYNHRITKTEMDFLIYQVRNTHDFTEEEKRQLEEKLIEELASKHYQLADEKIPPELIHYFENKDHKLITKNLQLLRKAIEDGYMVEFHMLRLNSIGESERFEKKPYLISPYKIIYYNGDFWLLANCQREHLYGEEYKYKFSNGVTIYRIDKMHSLKIATERLWYGVKTKKCRYPYCNEEKIELWNDQACFLHKEEFAESGKTVSAPEIAFEIIWDKFPKKERNDYTFIYDAFGNNFKVKKKTVYVKASLKFFENWVMQYADKVVVTEDTDASKLIKERIKKKIEEIKKIYK